MDQRQMLAKALLGGGMAGKAADVQQLQPIYQQQMAEAQMNGQPPIPFEQWAQQFMQQQQEPGMVAAGP